jgi:hypothetical protein
MSRLLRPLVTLAEDLSSVPSPHTIALQIPGDLIPPQASSHTYIHVSNIHILDIK